MIKVKYILLLILVSYTNQAYHCLQSYRQCNLYNNPQVAHCKFWYGNQCLECEENYSVSNDRSSCINFANCYHFDQQGKCQQYQNYYNFNEEGKCVKDYCMSYNPDLEEKPCLQCYPGFYIDNGECKRISIPHCLSWDGNTCIDCIDEYDFENGECKVPTKFIEGCRDYNDDRTCNRCYENYNLDKGTCTFQNSCQGVPTIDFCLLCEDGYYSTIYTHQCIGYDGSREEAGSNGNNNSNNAKKINIKYSFPFLLLILII